MKYKRKKSSSSKYISQTSSGAKKEARKRARLKKASGICVCVIVLMFCISASIGPGKNQMLLKASKTIPVLNDISDFFNGKTAFISAIGKKGAEFFFGYLRGEDEKEEKVFAESEAKEQASDSCADSDAQSSPLPQNEQYIFAPSMPCVGAISSPFGERVHPINGEGSFHNGIDIAADAGTTVAAIADGTVEKSTYNQYSGNFIVIRHDDEYTSSYAHLAESKVSAGDTVKKGDIIGLVGSTGAATGPHLHMEIRKSDEPVDPLALIEKEGQY